MPHGHLRQDGHADLWPAATGGQHVAEGFDAQACSDACRQPGALLQASAGAGDRGCRRSAKRLSLDEASSYPRSAGRRAARHGRGAGRAHHQPHEAGRRGPGHRARFSARQPPAWNAAIAIDGRYAATYAFRDEPRTEGVPFVHHLLPKHRIDRIMLVSGDRESEVRYLADAGRHPRSLRRPEPRAEAGARASRDGPAPRHCSWATASTTRRR